jgi:hypothetical protein
MGYSGNKIDSNQWTLIQKHMSLAMSDIFTTASCMNFAYNNI